LLSFIRNVFHNIRDFTVKNPAKGINGVGADTFVLLWLSKLNGTDVKLLNQGILADTHHIIAFQMLIEKIITIKIPLST